jgi:H+-translocating NAD(P) transhydrogenase subunit alpha
VKVGVPRETAPNERRVALVPEVVKRLASKDIGVIVESGAGQGALLPDELFTDAGAEIGDPYSADVVAKVAAPTQDEIAKLRDGQVLVGFLSPLTNPELAERLSGSGVTAFAMESIPRITRAQAMDALSSQANIGGYRAALVASTTLQRFFPMLMTAAGTIRPANVLVLGVGVAGLQAIATARRLGAQVTGYDVRPEVAEQVQSLGAKWLDVGVDAAGEGGYARELTEEERAKQQQGLQDAIANFDAVITTANVPGRKAPVLVTAAAVESMKPGSVIVDMAGESGGNCELTEPGETVVKHDVTIIAPINLPSQMAEHASQLYARNIQSLVELFLDDEGNVALDFDDEIIAGACVTQKKETPA